MFDRTEKINKSTIQHGKNNNRIYLMKLDREDDISIIKALDELAEREDYSKIIAKVPDWAFELFIRHGYKNESTIPGFYNGKNAVHFMSKFTKDRGLLSPDSMKIIDDHISIAATKKNELKSITLPAGFTIRMLGEQDIDALVDLYKSVFSVYPFPIFDAAYIQSTMRDYIQYFGVFNEGKLCATSSAEIDADGTNAEMTDFARHPDCSSGLNLSYLLLNHMEKAMKVQKIKTLYTIARAYSVGMNATFARLNYTLAGTLVNNTLIGDGIESMNVWYKNGK